MNKFLRRVVAFTKALPVVIKLHAYLENKQIRKLIDVLCMPIGLIGYLVSKKMTKKSKMINKIDVCVIVKNEARYIKEWIEYHRLIGIKNFYIFDNDSNDNLKKILTPYIKQGFVHYEAIHGHVRQLDAYNLSLRIARKKKHYLLALDADEFIFLPNPKDNFIDVVNDIFTKNDSIGGIVFNWVIFGSSGYEKMQNKLITQTYFHRSQFNFKFNQHVKTLVNPQKTIAFVNPHFACYTRGSYAVNIDNIKVDGPYSKPINNPKVRINHYFTKSKEEFMAKRARGMADNNNIRDIKDYEKHNRNEVFDDSMRRYAEKL